MCDWLRGSSAHLSYFEMTFVNFPFFFYLVARRVDDGRGRWWILFRAAFPPSPLKNCKEEKADKICARKKKKSKQFFFSLYSFLALFDTTKKTWLLAASNGHEVHTQCAGGHLKKSSLFLAFLAAVCCKRERVEKKKKKLLQVCLAGFSLRLPPAARAPKIKPRLRPSFFFVYWTAVVDWFSLSSCLTRGKNSWTSTWFFYFSGVLFISPWHRRFSRFFFGKHSWPFLFFGLFFTSRRRHIVWWNSFSSGRTPVFFLINILFFYSSV